MSDLLRLAVAAWVVLVLVRSARNALDRRDLIALVWRGVTARAYARAFGLLLLTMLAATVLLEAVPPLRFGLGTLVAFDGNAVFTPLEEAAGAMGPAPALGPDWPLIALTTLFLGFLGALLPWLAFVEEEIFRAGLETEKLAGEVWWALRFGLAHLVMLVPVGAALAIAVAGFGYGRVYRRGVRDAAAADLVPAAALAAFRPTRRSRRAADLARPVTPENAILATIDQTAERRQAAGVLAAASVHTAFNATVLTIVWLAIVIPALNR